MRRNHLTLSFIILSLLVGGCGGGANSSSDPNSAQNSSGMLIQLAEGGYLKNGDAIIYFPPQDINQQIEAALTGSGSSKTDPLTLSVKLVSSDADKVVGSKEQVEWNDDLKFYVTGSGNATLTAGEFVSVGMTFESNGEIYSCDGTTYPGSGSIIEGAVLGPGNKQYLHCIKVQPTDHFTVNFYLDEDSLSDAGDDLGKNIKVLKPLCADKDCGDLAEPIDMDRLLSVHVGPLSEYSYLSGSKEYYDNSKRKGAYKKVLLELFTQTYLWQDYQKIIEGVSGLEVGLDQWVNETVDAVDLFSTAGGFDHAENMIVLNDAAIAFIKRNILKWSKHANDRYVINRASKYFTALSFGVDVSVELERGVFKYLLYQILGSAFSEAYVHNFEEQILPLVKDPALRDAFSEVKDELLGDPETGEGGLLYDSVMQNRKAMNETAEALGAVTVKTIFSIVATDLIATGIGAGAGASLGVPPVAIAAGIVTTLLAAADDQLSFFAEREILVGLATFIHNNYFSSEISDKCPADDNKMEEILLAQNMLYGARLYFSLLSNSYDRWLVKGYLMVSDVIPWLAVQLGIEDEDYIWAGPRADALAEKEEKYEAKTVKALENLYKCQYPDDEEFYELEAEPDPEVCEDHASSACSEGDVYWYDSCGEQEELKQDCGESGYDSATYCSADGSVFRDYITRSCSVDHCTETTRIDLISDCALGCTDGGCNSCVHACAAGSTRCAGGELFNCIADAAGCRVWDSGSSCASGTCAADGLVCLVCASHDHIACYNNDEYYYDSCGDREEKAEECGASGWSGGTYCSMDDVYKNYIERGCSGVSCTESTEARKYEECGSAGCEDGACCEAHDHKECYRDDVYWYSSCGDREERYEDCGEFTCSSGRCICPSTSWGDNRLTATEFGSFVGLGWHAAPSWVDHYVVTRRLGSGTPPITYDIATTTMTIINDFGGDSGRCYTYAIYAVNGCGNYSTSNSARACFD